MGAEHMRIGEVAARTGLFLRTIRYYGDVGLARPTARTQGGFRLYAEDDVQRLLLIKRMKPLDFSLEETGELVEALDRLAAGERDARERRVLLERIEGYRAAAEARSAELRGRLKACEAFAVRLSAVHAEHHDSA